MFTAGAAACADPGTEPSPAISVAVREKTLSTSDPEWKLAEKHGCALCHQVDRRLIGPSYREVAARYDQSAALLLTHSICNGLSDRWGLGNMPAHPRVLRSDVTTLVAWILALPGSSSSPLSGNLYQPVFRFAKISNGAYFLTGDASEKEAILAGYPDFRYEGIAFYQRSDAAGQPVYRFANLTNGGYFYTASEQERESVVRGFPQFRFEGTSFSVGAVDGAVARPVYRLANLSNGAYLFTGSAEERSFALGLGHWRDEGVAFEAVTQDGLPTSSVQTGPSALSGACDPTSDTGAAD